MATDWRSRRRVTAFALGAHRPLRVLAACSIVGISPNCTRSANSLPNPNGAAGDRLGYAVAIDSSWAIAAAPEGDSVALNGGKVLVYRLSGANWTFVRTLVPGSPVAYGLFGSAVDLRGAHVIVGGYQQLGQPTSGAVYIYERSGTSWTQSAELHGDTLAWRFGASVAIDGDFAIVGAPGPSHVSITGPGVAYVYHRDSSGNWSRDTVLTASDAVSYMEFGSSVAIDGELLLIGAHGGQFVMDAAYVFRRSGSTWTQEAKLTPLDTPGHRYFGNSVSLSRGIAVVGAPYDNAKGTRAGAAYVFERDSLGAWLQVRKLLPSSLTEEDAFGASVSTDFPRAIVGAYGGIGPGDLTGTSFQYRRGRHGWKFVFELFAQNGAYGDAFGSSVAISGDCAIVGAPDRDVGGSLKGAAYIYCIPVPGLEELEIDIICCWQPPIPQPVVATIRYRNTGQRRVVGRAGVELVSPSGKVSESGRPDQTVVDPGESLEERVVVPMPLPIERGRYELRLRWLDETGERIERGYFIPPGRNEAALGVNRQR